MRESLHVLESGSQVQNAIYLARAVGGQAGVEAVVRQLAAELDLTCALAGVPVARDVDRRLVT
jgi:isopentenyl diphosphate isomerase/L-lactate dehydrogenase-like FMN-dependent dehydrogenase